MFNAKSLYKLQNILIKHFPTSSIYLKHAKKAKT